MHCFSYVQVLLCSLSPFTCTREVCFFMRRPPTAALTVPSPDVAALLDPDQLLCMLKRLPAHPSMLSPTFLPHFN